MNPIRDDKAEKPLIYEIRIKGHLDCEWAVWFENLSITHEADGNTLLSGPVVDQAALYALLKKLHEFGLPLISFHEVNSAPKAPQREGG